jgi:polar amino acid transport system substrate-binding protein
VNPATPGRPPTARRSPVPIFVVAIVVVLLIQLVGNLIDDGASSQGTGVLTTTTQPRSQATTTTTAPAAPAGECPLPGVPDVASFAPGSAGTTGSVDRIRQRGRLIVGVSADTKLFGSRNPFTGELEGFDIDMLKQVATAIFGAGGPAGIEYRVIAYADRLPVLENGSVDLVAHTMTINCERWKRIAFSSEYFHAGQKILLRSDLVDRGVDTVEELDGQKVCAPEGSTNIDEIRKRRNVDTVGAPDLTDCLVLFQQGQVDGITGDDTVLAGFAAQDPYARVVGTNFTEEPYGIGVKRDQPDLVRFVNGVLERIRADGTWGQIYERWLGPVDPAPGPPAPPQPVYGRLGG